MRNRQQYRLPKHLLTLYLNSPRSINQDEADRCIIQQIESFEKRLHSEINSICMQIVWRCSRDRLYISGTSAKWHCVLVSSDLAQVSIRVLQGDSRSKVVRPRVASLVVPVIQEVVLVGLLNNNNPLLQQLLVFIVQQKLGGIVTTLVIILRLQRDCRQMKSCLQQPRAEPFSNYLHIFYFS